VLVTHDMHTPSVSWSCRNLLGLGLTCTGPCLGEDTGYISTSHVLRQPSLFNAELSVHQSKEGHLASQLQSLRCTLDQERLAHQERLQQVQQEHRAAKALLAKELKLSMEGVSIGLRHELQVLCAFVSFTTWTCTTSV
jgi:hypothetical protein